MSRHRIVRSAEGPSLFPFLAVLICTMGALIVLLVAMVQHARTTAESRAETLELEQQQLREEQIREAKWKIEDNQWQADVLLQSRDATAQQLADHRNQLSHLEDHIRRLREEAERLIRELEWLEKEDGNESTFKELENELASLNALREQSERDLAKARERADRKARTYAIIPYDGRNGTQRRPVYIECRGDRIVLQPTGVTLVFEDFLPPLGTHNPLAAALRATREYWSQHAEDVQEPYPLLIVRPDGAEAYAAARNALSSWDSDFGYELVDESMKLAFPPNDSHLTALQQEVVAAARVRQRSLRASAPRRYQPTAQQAWSVRASRQGGFVREPGGTSEWTGDAPVDGRSNRHAMTRRGPRLGNRADGMTGPNGDGQTQNFPGYADGESLRPGSHAATPSGVAGQGGPYTPVGARSHVAGSDPSSPQASPNSDEDGRHVAGRSSGNPGSDGTAGPAQQGSQYPATASAPGRGSQMGGGNDARGADQPETPGVAAQSRNTAGGTAGPQAQAASGSSANGSSGGSMGGQPGMPAPNMDPSQGQAAPNLTLYSPRAMASSSAMRRGNNWGLPSSSMGAIPLARPIRVMFYQDTIRILPDPNSQEPPQEFQIQYSSAEIVDELVMGVWEHMRQWGTAGTGAYWKPVLNVRVHPTADLHYQEFEQAMAGSGIRIQRMKR